MLPRVAYVDVSVFEWEQHHFFERGWVTVGRAEDLRPPGSQRAVTVGKSGVLLVRGRDDCLRAFANVCRHRGHELLPCGGEAQTRQLVICPYHSWSYRLDGTLRQAPGFDGTADFDQENWGLVQLPVAEWHGYLFVNASGTAPPIDAYVRGLDSIVSSHEPERLVTVARHEYVVLSNWKIINENYQECYHCPSIHPELCVVSPPSSGKNYPPGPGAWVGGSMTLRPGIRTMSLDGASGASPLRNLDSAAKETVLYMAIFPNVLLSLHPDYVMTHVLTPLAADQTRVECSWAFAPEDVERSYFDPSYAVDFWDIVNRQDWAACESVQRGHANPHHKPGPLSSAEDAVYHFVTMVARGYSGLPLGTPSEPHNV